MTLQQKVNQDQDKNYQKLTDTHSNFPAHRQTQTTSNNLTSKLNKLFGKSKKKKLKKSDSDSTYQTLKRSSQLSNQPNSEVFQPDHLESINYQNSQNFQTKNQHKQTPRQSDARQSSVSVKTQSSTSEIFQNQKADITNSNLNPVDNYKDSVKIHEQNSTRSSHQATSYQADTTETANADQTTLNTSITSSNHIKKKLCRVNSFNTTNSYSHKSHNLNERLEDNNITAQIYRSNSSKNLNQKYQSHNLHKGNSPQHQSEHFHPNSSSNYSPHTKNTTNSITVNCNSQNQEKSVKNKTHLDYQNFNHNSYCSKQVEDNLCQTKSTESKSQVIGHIPQIHVTAAQTETKNLGYAQQIYNVDSVLDLNESERSSGRDPDHFESLETSARNSCNSHSNTSHYRNHSYSQKISVNFQDNPNFYQNIERRSDPSRYERQQVRRSHSYSKPGVNRNSIGCVQ